jgi:phosphoglycolate phosphatase-like HAD superfamily hydrolase
LRNFSLKEYQRLINLGDWRAELANLPDDYAPPDGCLLIAQFQTETAGCVALRKFNNRACEMKRMWVRSRVSGPRSRTENLIAEARLVGYAQMVLDSLPSLESASALYRPSGFVRYRRIDTTLILAPCLCSCSSGEAESEMHLVVFDIDGTLTDTNVVDGECYWQAVCEVLEIFGEQPDWSRFRNVTDAGIAAELCVRHRNREVNGKEIEAIGARLTALLELALAGEDPVALQIPGAAEILSMLSNSSQFAIALATGGLRLSAELKLRRAGLPFTLLPMASSTDAVSREDILRIVAGRAAEKHARQFTSFTYVGDGVWDVRTARELGWRFIGIGSGQRAEQLRAAGASTVIPHYRPVETFLRLLNHDRVRMS